MSNENYPMSLCKTSFVLLSLSGEITTHDGDYVIVGRAETADIVLPGETVSPKHAVFSRCKSGWTITDEGSANGTRVNNQKLAPYTAHKLKNLDVIFIPCKIFPGVSKFSKAPPPQVNRLPDGTVVLDSLDPLTRDYKFIYFNALRKSGRTTAKNAHLRYDSDGILYYDMQYDSDFFKHKWKQCRQCGTFSEMNRLICPVCGRLLLEKGLGIYHDPVECSPQYKKIKKELDVILKRLFPTSRRGLCHAIWATKKTILLKWYHIRWRTPNEMNPRVYFD